MIRKIAFHAALMAILVVPFSIAAQAIDDQHVMPEHVESGDPPAADIVNMDSVTVTGVHAGPGLWRVSKGDHDLWILGALYPLPNDITWNSDAVVDLVSQSQEVLWGPSFIINADVGIFRKVSLGYGAYRAQKNPNGEKLNEVLSPELYSRWAEAKKLYLPRDKGIESKRPMIAASEIFGAAVKVAGLGKTKIILPPIQAAIKAGGIKETTPKFTFKIADSAGVVKEVRRMSLNDSACLAATLDAIEYLLPRMITNANAWATGNLDVISFSQLAHRNNTCTDVFSNTEISVKLGIPDIRASIKTEWLKAAETSLASNTSTFAVLPLQEIVGPDGYAARLRAMGYEVDAP